MQVGWREDEGGPEDTGGEDDSLEEQRAREVEETVCRNPLKMGIYFRADEYPFSTAHRRPKPGMSTY